MFLIGVFVGHRLTVVSREIEEYAEEISRQ